ncbi:GntR family transcriptional regulator [Micromonospora marina]|uniref:GntR family transcriptional regulator n=1 Tax=Micromonospora marina TaxID=307120 RepID=UPI003D7207CF
MSRHTRSPVYGERCSCIDVEAVATCRSPSPCGRLVGLTGGAADLPTPPAYSAIAADLRAAILSGELPAGARLPSASGLMRQYDVSRTVMKFC